ncbi:putative protein, PH0010 family [Desulfocurvibacter africanus PCS]|uniref:AMMECR1 domain-containing protein n=1 Tax=Desulfocurvibacter africanus PCS TaxID=1262666 RepID=M5Q2C2_DESAF|nr:AmmeMemoRadiSam system protein A [Desulfocurvibacter africanus]EMG37298.1 putative protein, PH0010 family [Desulfocurvibacter africanus PCS]
MAEFRFHLPDEEKAYLKNLVRQSIGRCLTKDDTPLPEPPTEILHEKLGLFVCLKIRGRLRGCVGHIVGDKPLYQTVAEMALCAAFEDPRFPPLTADELENAEIEISVLSPLTPCPDPAQVEVGRHGLLMRQGMRSGLLLPQVPVEWGWDRETFLRQTCAKAGLGSECWKDPRTAIFWFEAEVF